MRCLPPCTRLLKMHMRMHYARRACRVCAVPRGAHLRCTCACDMHTLHTHAHAVMSRARDVHAHVVVRMQCARCTCGGLAPQHGEAELRQLKGVHLGLPRARALHQEVHAQRGRRVAAAAAQPHEPSRHEHAHLALRRRHRRTAPSRGARWCCAATRRTRSRWRVCMTPIRSSSPPRRLAPTSASPVETIVIFLVFSSGVLTSLATWGRT